MTYSVKRRSRRTGWGQRPEIRDQTSEGGDPRLNDENRKQHPNHSKDAKARRETGIRALTSRGYEGNAERELQIADFRSQRKKFPALTRRGYRVQRSSTSLR
jgi:hypothetical protein